MTQRATFTPVPGSVSKKRSHSDSDMALNGASVGFPKASPMMLKVFFILRALDQ